MQDIINTHLLRKDESLVSNFLFKNFIFILIILQIMLAIDIHSKRTLETTDYDLAYEPQDSEGQCTLLAVQTLASSTWKKVLVILLSIITIGIPFLLMHWWPNLKRALLYSYASFDRATHFIIENYDNTIEIVEKEEDTFFDGYKENTYVYFTNRYLKYLIKGNTVVALKYHQKDRISEAMKGSAKGWSTSEAGKMEKAFGPGAMMIHQPTACEIFWKEIVRPLYIFLILNLALQLEIQYYYYCFVIGISAIIGIVLTIVEMLRVNAQIHEMSYYEVSLSVLRNGAIMEVSSLHIVPGDIVFFSKPIRLPFEGILLEGEMLINECVLTGESVPVVKKAEAHQNLLKKEGQFDKTGIVYEGTTIVQINSKKKMLIWQKFRETYGIPVCVTKTNFITLKGQLIRKILYPDQSETKFQSQSRKFLFFLFFLTVVSYTILTIRLHKYIDPWTLVRRGLDLITITVPPTLPISMTIGIIYAIKKLKAKDIFTISPNQIIDGGVLDTMCFDKTGTLTTDTMDFKSLLIAEKGRFEETIQIAHYEKPKSQPKHLEISLANMACNHTVVKLESTGELIGDPMEIQLLKFSQCKLINQTTNPYILFLFDSPQVKGEVYKRYDFDSALQRMSVVSKINDQFYLFAKGSPEIMLSIMDPKSIPSDYQTRLRQFASSGYRILAIASKIIKEDYRNVGRQSLESNLKFNGFEIFENSLKPETRGAIEELRQVNINPIMITGDNPITASNISYQSAILDPDTKTIIVDYSHSRFVEEEFSYNCKDLPEVKFQREPFKRQSKQSLNCDTEELKFVDTLLQKVEKNNYNICLTGSAFHQLFGSVQVQKKETLHPHLKDLLQGTQIFSRTKPYDKSNVVVMYQNLGRVVGFCGDGANDCAALSKADLGLSLSDTEASIAAAFTAKQRHVGSMVELIKESRAALATNYSLFDIIACYALTQYSASIIDQFFFSYPADFQFVYQDLVLNAFFVFILGNIQTEDKLCKEKPSNTLFSVANITQLVAYHIIQTASQILCVVAAGGPYADSLNYYAIAGEKVNYKRYQSQGRGDFLMQSTENNITFLISNCFLLASIIGFIITRPWKKEFYTYWPFTVFFLLALIYTIVMIIVPEVRLSIFKLNKIDSKSFCLFLFQVSVGVSILIVFLQKCVFIPLFRWIQDSQQQKEKERRRDALEN